jgi:hypothetical protein
MNTPNFNPEGKVKGFITQKGFLIGKTPQQMERLLGLPPFSLQNGAGIYALLQLPRNHQFSLAKGYSQMAQDSKTAKSENQARFSDKETEIEMRILKRSPLDYQKQMARNNWALEGNNCLVKVVGASKLSFSKENYPPGEGVPQWVLDEDMDAKLIASLNYDQPFRL